MSVTEPRPAIEGAPDEQTPENLIGLIESIRRLLGYFAGYPGQVAFIVFVLLLEMGFTALIPICLKLLIDHAIPHQDQTAMLLTLGGLSAGVVLISVTGVALDWVFFRTVSRIIQQQRLKLYTHLQRLNMDFFQRVRIPNVLATFSGDLAPVEQVVASAAAGFVAPLMDLAISLALIFTLDWRLALVAMFIWPLSLLGPRVLSPKASLASYRYKTEEAHTVSYIEENLSAHEVIKAYALENHSISGFQRLTERLAQRGTRMGFLSGSVERSAFIGISIFQVLVIGVGAYLAFLGQITMGTFVSFQALTMTLSSAVAIVMNYLPGLLKAAGGMQRIDDLLGERPRVVDAPDSQAVVPLRTAIALRGVCLHSPEHAPSLDGLDLEIPRAQRLALLGAAGSGKSHVVSLLMRFQDPTAGSLRFDETDYRALSQAGLRSEISLLTAESVFFSASIKENIRLGKLAASDDEVVEAARQAGIHDGIMTLPRAYDTPLGENGPRLSGEQKLRISLARALIRKPSLLILHEATARLDVQAEQRFIETVAAAQNQASLLIVTHRVAMAQHAERIVLLEEGRIVQQGEHAELVTTEGAYRRIWEKQSGFVEKEGAGYVDVQPEWLRRFPLFAPLERGVLSEISGLFLTERFAAKSTIFAESDPGERFYIIVRGSVEVSRLGADGEPRRLAVLEDGDYFGELALIADAPRTATLRALTPCAVLTLTREHFLHLMEKHPGMREEVMRVGSARLQASA